MSFRLCNLVLTVIKSELIKSFCVLLTYADFIFLLFKLVNETPLNFVSYPHFLFSKNWIAFYIQVATIQL